MNELRDIHQFSKSIKKTEENVLSLECDETAKWLKLLTGGRKFGIFICYDDYFPMLTYMYHYYLLL